jgi:hypothetical protein
MLKKIIKKSVNCFGYDICKLKVRQEPDKLSSAFESAMVILLMIKKKLKIVQVGANDGKFADPLYYFAKAFKDKTQILLIEPQESLIPYLSENYSFHPDHKIWAGAIGPGGHLTLYAIKKEIWPLIKMPSYAKGWPVYRAPTGATSGDPEHTKKWLSTYYKGDAEAAIETIHPESMKLVPLLDKLGLGPEIDVLQVDAEGLDDQVIYNCSIEKTRPKIIHFESHSLDYKMIGLRRHLESAGYCLSNQGDNTLALYCECF